MHDYDLHHHHHDDDDHDDDVDDDYVDADGDDDDFLGCWFSHGNVDLLELHLTPHFSMYCFSPGRWT